MTTTRSVLVTGDIVVDRHIYEGHRLHVGDHSSHGTRILEERGGAALTQRLICAVFNADFAEREVRHPVVATRDSSIPEAPRCLLGCQVGSGSVGESAPDWLATTTAWAALPKSGSSDLFWRMTKSYGFGWQSPDAATASAFGETALRATDNGPTEHGILVLDDAGDRFRQIASASAWHLPNDSSIPPRWIVLKLSGAVGRGDLWDHLMEFDPRHRLIIVVSAAILRESGALLSQGLSWESSVEQLLNELDQTSSIQPLRHARHLIVTFGTDGAVWIDFSTLKPSARLVYDAAHTEGEWSPRIPGEAFGYQTCLAATVVQALIAAGSDDREPNLVSAMERGLSAMRLLKEEGHGVARNSSGAFQAGEGFPVARLADEILHPTHRFVHADVPAHPESLVAWSILASWQDPASPTRPLFGFARQLAMQGNGVLDHIPHLRIGKLLAVGRTEVEALRSLRRIMTSYRDTNSGKRPLSIGVFGAPGSGKSFGVEQTALGVFAQPGQSTYGGWLEFNLSQFDRPSDLVGAFHQIRDRVLQGFTPVVFWDEFDSQNFKWLQFLLAPMQDGRFQEEQITHTLGKAVFVFAGGTAATFDEFGPTASDPAFTAFKHAKGPDFKSRLDGFLNVVGPNSGGDEDVSFPVRRALLMRSLLGCRSNERLEIEGGLLTALLEVPSYRHGARSLAKILEPLCADRQSSHAPLRRSQLPAAAQLSLHVNSDQFQELCTRDLSFKADEVAGILARSTHETWRSIARVEGQTLMYDVPFDELPPSVKRSNEAAARRIPELLALVGLKVEPGVATASEIDGVRRQLEQHIETLAEEEHRGWMSNAESDGWRFAEVRDNDARLHNCLRPFHELSEVEKDKDRSSVRHVPEFVQLAGFRIVCIDS